MSRIGLRTLSVFLFMMPATLVAAEKIVFNRDIRPLLSDQCFACHGPDANKRKSNLRLDIREEAIKPAKSGAVAIVPGQLDQSELLKRIHSTDPDELMPPEKTHKSLTPEQKATFKQWIAEGAEYQAHWAYLPVVKPAVDPALGNPIDTLVAARQKALGLVNSPEADKRTLIRRLYADLIGLPAPAVEVEAFVNDQAPDAYEKLVDRLLGAPAYGERMAVWWLDLVRYADSAGYHSDKERNVSPFRDYVIASFNQNKPFDQMTIEHLAGDLLPNASLEQKIGSCFNKLLLTTDEGGAQAKDYEARYMQDRVRAVGAVWMAQTWLCSQCHDHKFDPMLTRDFYSMGAFFADIDEGIIASPEAGIPVFTPEQQQAHDGLIANRDRLQTALNADTPEGQIAYLRWEDAQLQASVNPVWSALQFGQRTATDGPNLEDKGQGIYHAQGANPDKSLYTLTTNTFPSGMTGLRLEAVPSPSLPAQGSGRADNGNFVVTEVKARLIRADGSVIQELPFAQASASFEQSIANEAHPDKKWSAASAIDGDARGAQFGWAILPHVTQPQSLWLSFAAPMAAAADAQMVVEIHQNHGSGHHTLGQFRISATTHPMTDAVSSQTALLPPALAAVLTKPMEKRSPDEQKSLLTHYRSIAPEWAETRQQLADTTAKLKEMEDKAVRCIVTRSTPSKRTVRVLPRGDFLNESGSVVTAALPSYLPKPNIEGREPNRLDLAQWIVSRDNPLTARVLVNRLWKLFHGIGLSKPLEDFGLQGEMPPNAPLLDWLAAEMMDRKWNVKDMVKLMVTSKTYRQISEATPEMLARDPENRELTRQSRYRLDAEFVRDYALETSRLLVRKIGGPSVKPYQPEGYWENLNFPARNWDASSGESQYRRGLYTWWQRMFLHPSMLAFDATTREECTAERTRSNIPQQALALLNDPSYVEAARGLAVRVLKEARGDDLSRITWLWREALQRTPTDSEKAALLQLLAKHREEFHIDAPSALAFGKLGAPAPADIDGPELAAWSSVTRVVMNLHEFITRS